MVTVMSFAGLIYLLHFLIQTESFQELSKTTSFRSNRSERSNIGTPKFESGIEVFISTPKLATI